MDGKQPNFRYEFTPEWDDLAYTISRGRMDRVKAEVRMNQEFTGEAIFRPNGETVLHCCAEYGQHKLFEWLVEEYQADINAVNDDGETPLMLAARGGKIEIC